MLPARLHSGVPHNASPNRMFPPNKDLADSRQVSANNLWVQRQVEEAMKNLPSDLEVLPSPPLLEEMELAPAGPGSGRGAVDLLTFLSREVERTLRRSAGLSVPQSACDGSRLAIPCPGTGPLRRCSPPAPLVAHQGQAAKPTSSSRRKKRQAARLPVFQPVSHGRCCDVWSGGFPVRAATSRPASSPATALSPRLAAASKPASLSATTLSPRLAAAPPMPSSFTPAQCSEATPKELEQRLRFFARHKKSFRKTSLLYSSPELMEKIRQLEEDYGMAVRQFYCRPPSLTPGLQRAASEQPMPGLQGAAPRALLQSSPRRAPRALLQSSPLCSCLRRPRRLCFSL
ncbi:hypothetical protein CRENBAI_005615 [Crenichthys baileyi]|uniref:Uncharacterized protein n=1 Tax=Crenichthys baileyi TaxID=28760 RepID=A0AAV9RV17_9TELE